MQLGLDTRKRTESTMTYSARATCQRKCRARISKIHNSEWFVFDAHDLKDKVADAIKLRWIYFNQLMLCLPQDEGNPPKSERNDPVRCRLSRSVKL